MSPIDTFLFGVVLAAGGAVAGAFLMWWKDRREDRAFCARYGITPEEWKASQKSASGGD